VEHLALFAGFRGVPAADGGVRREAALRLADVGLSDEASTPASGLSGGMRRRLSLAIASVGDPRVIYLDEPGAGLDPNSRFLLWRVVQKLKAEPGAPRLSTSPHRSLYLLWGSGYVIDS
jgi:ABC-2 type transport system ATP-binding protein